MSGQVALFLLLAIGLRTGIIAEEEGSGNCSCPWQLYRHYTGRNCKPIYEDGKCCPQRFECSPVELNNTHCIFKDKIYKVDENVDVGNPCQECSCHSGFDKNSAAKLDCISVECPSLFGPLPKLEDGCEYIREEGKCCEEKICTNSTEPDTVTCSYLGKTYKRGDYIDLGDQYPCKSCYCQEGFNGPDGPGCSNVTCGYVSDNYRIKKNCAPIYRSSLCCSFEWFCHPEGTTSQTFREVCQNPLDTGLQSCTDFKTRYYYNTELGRCEKFNYTGCIGNMNNFQTLKGCEHTCEQNNLCSLPPSADNCNGTETTKYYYDPKTAKCNTFQYKGCPANGNIFDTEQQCLQKCGVQLQDRSDANLDICQMSSDKGPCDDNVQKYFYNPESKHCEQFTYGGCKGNGNNFNTVEECQQLCKSETSDTNLSNMCSFGNYKFPMGHELDTGTACRNCTCMTPPLFTCVEKGCP